MLKRLRYRLEFVVVRATGWLIQRLPLARAQALGRLLGLAAYHLGVARRDARVNLEQRLGVQGEERDAILKQAYQGFGQTMLELVFMPALPAEDLKWLFEFEGMEALKAVNQSGRGIVCMSAHFGNWEWMGAALVQHGFPVTFLIGTQSNPWVDAQFNAHRAGKGMKMVRISAIRDGLRVLKNGGLVALLGDQDGDKWGTFVPFFGVAASTHSIGELLARRSGSAIAFGVPVRWPDGRSCMKIHILADPPADLSDAQSTAWTLTEYNRLLEAVIRENPGHWLWMHHRWSSIPRHRLSGELRQRADRGEIDFDTRDQVWRDRAGSVVPVEGWK